MQKAIVAATVPLALVVSSCEKETAEGRGKGGFLQTATAGQAEEPGGLREAAARVSPEIADILATPDAYRDREVEIRGTFQGWSGTEGGPAVTRSDWVVADGTGAIYVVGGFPPGCAPPTTGVGARIVARGHVRLDPRGHPYIEKKETGRQRAADPKERRRKGR